MVDVINFCPGARFSSRLNCWLPVVRVFKNNKPIGSKTGSRPMPGPLVAEAHAVRAAENVTRKLLIAGVNATVTKPKRGEVKSLPSERVALSPGAVAGTRLLQVQV